MTNIVFNLRLDFEINFEIDFTNANYFVFFSLSLLEPDFPISLLPLKSNPFHMNHTHTTFYPISNMIQIIREKLILKKMNNNNNKKHLNISLSPPHNICKLKIC